MIEITVVSNVNKVEGRGRPLSGEGRLTKAATSQGGALWHLPHAPPFSKLVHWPQAAPASQSIYTDTKIITKEANIEI